MDTKETPENQNDDTSKLYEEVARKISEVRRASGLSHFELSGKLSVPICYTEILENGILIQADDKSILPWNACPFTKEELLRISRQLSKGISSRSSVRSINSETVFFCPVTISSTVVFDELQRLAKCRNLTVYLARQASDGFSMKYRLFFKQFYLKHGKKNADLLKRRLLSVLDKHEA